jgi:hypothetical protein
VKRMKKDTIKSLIPLQFNIVEQAKKG